jgi:hypothetical protein
VHAQNLEKPQAYTQALGYPLVATVCFESSDWDNRGKVAGFDVIDAQVQQETGEVVFYILLQNQNELDMLQQTGLDFETDENETKAIQDEARSEVKEEFNVGRRLQVYDSIDDARYSCYRTVAGTIATMMTLTSDNPNLASYEELTGPVTAEGNGPLKLIKITNTESTVASEEKGKCLPLVAVTQGNIHPPKL